jgi:glycosyltransferase involved in cell wall biosynthesis
MEKSFDICIICMNYFNNDARTYNLVNTLISQGQTVAVIAFEDINDTSYPFDFFPVPINPNIKLYKNLVIFTKFISKNYSKIKAKFYLSSELYSLPATRIIQKKNNGILIYDSREIYSAIGNVHNKPLKQLFFKYLEKYYIRFVDKIIVTGELDAEFLKSYFNHNTPYFLIMNLPFYKEIEQSDLIRSYFKIDYSKKILLYQGMIMQGRGIESAIELLKNNVDFVLCVMGAKNEYSNKLVSFAIENRVEDRVFFKDQVAYNELHKWTCSADIGIALFEPISFSYKLALPNKLFEYAMAGIPVLASNLPAIQNITTGYEFAKLVDYPFDQIKLSESLKELNNPENENLIRKSTLEFSKKYNYESQISEIKKVFGIK